MLEAPLAYKYVAMAMMLAEINHCATNLHLPTHLPLTEQDIRAASVFDPGKFGFMGRVDTDKYSFCFWDGKLRFITSLEDERGTLSLGEYQKKLAKLPSALGADDASRVATSWLQALDVDVNKLTREARLNVQQWATSFPSGNAPTNTLTPLPVFDVEWGSRDKPAIKVTLSAIDGKLLALRQEELSYSRRPPLATARTEELLGISDEHFRDLTLQQRRALVARFGRPNSTTAPNQERQGRATNPTSN